MNANRKFIWIVALLLAVPMLITAPRPRLFREADTAEGREEAALVGRCLPMSN